MAYFSENDINEAKKRVNDMQKRAKSLTNDNDKEYKKTDEEKSEALNEENKEEKDDSSLIILAPVSYTHLTLPTKRIV